MKAGSRGVSGKRGLPKSKAAPPQPGPPRSPVALETLPEKEFVLDESLSGTFLDRAVRHLYPELSWNQARSLIAQGKVQVDGERRVETTFPLAVGSLIQVQPRAQKRGPARAELGMIVHQDSQVVVVNKPSGLATVPYEDSERDSLDRLVSSLLGRGGRPAKLHIVHRLDKETSGLLVFARTDAALKHLKNQFRFHTTQRRYVALAHGSVPHGTLRTFLVQDRGDGLRGSTNNPTLGREAITHVRSLEQFGNASLIECRLETGRTHQIRIHLAEAGHPLLGERVYSKGYSGTIVPATRVMLHATELGFEHPTEGRTLLFQSPPPTDFETRLGELRAGRTVKAPR